MTLRFDSTTWTVIAAARGTDSAAARDALAQLCSRYWMPLYTFVRRKGHARAEAEDLTQGFFTHLLAHGLVQRADHDRGRFRTYLLTCLNHYLLDEHDRAATARRGGGAACIALDFEAGEDRYLRLAGTESDPYLAFDREWAESLLGAAMARLEEEYRREGNGETYRVLQGCLGRSGDEASHDAAAARLGVSEGAVRVAVHRMRKRFAALTREEIARTVDGEAAVRDELRHLIEVMGGRRASL